MSEVISHQHDDQRWCVLTPTGHGTREWMFNLDQVGIGVVCRRQHPDAEHRQFGEGMPILGAPARIFMTDGPDVAVIRLDHAPTTPEGRRIGLALPAILNRFFRKNTGYARAQTGHDLGAKGIMPDINRKTSALLGRIWYGDQTTALQEDTLEVIDDLIGHLLLLRDKLTQEEDL